jgi:hypothetical protein
LPPENPGARPQNTETAFFSLEQAGSGTDGVFHEKKSTIFAADAPTNHGMDPGICFPFQYNRILGIVQV